MMVGARFFASPSVQDCPQLGALSWDVKRDVWLQLSTNAFAKILRFLLVPPSLPAVMLLISGISSRPSDKFLYRGLVDGSPCFLLPPAVGFFFVIALRRGLSISQPQRYGPVFCPFPTSPQCTNAPPRTSWFSFFAVSYLRTSEEATGRSQSKDPVSC